MIDFEKELIQSIKEYGDEYIEESMIDYTPHRFSGKFRRSIRAMIRKMKKSNKPKWSNVRWRSIPSIITLVFLSVFFCSGFDVPEFKEFIFCELDNDMVNVRLRKKVYIESDMSPRYLITEGIEGFKVESYMGGGIGAYFYDYVSPEGVLHFNQFDKFDFIGNYGFTNFEKERVEINGEEGIYVDEFLYKRRDLIWIQDDYVFEIFVDSNSIYEECPFSKSELISMAESVKKVE